MSRFLVSRDITLETLRCCACDITFAVPDYWLRDRQQNGKTFHCPNGHSQVFRDPENARLKRQLEAAKARAVHADDQRQAAERSAAAYKGQVTKIRKRVGNGVCPCCKRTFAQLARHMDAKHPGYAEQAESEAAK